MDVERIIRNASLREKVSLLAGLDFWHTTPLNRFDVPSIRCSDGPNGVRGTKFFNNVPAICIPCGTGLGATWNKELIFRAGILLSSECMAKGAHAWLGPTINMLRSPLNGRGFESFSEDPFLSGILAASIINGVQSNGTLAVLKHFVANDQETEKISVDVLVSDRALREIYLKPFQLALRHSSPASVMASYSKVQGVHCSESKQLLTNILRDEWGFLGLIMSDWFGTYSLEAALEAGLDLEMPGPTRFRTLLTQSAVASGKLKEDVINTSCRNLLSFVNKASQNVSKQEGERDTPEDRLLNYQLACESIVLLKNDNNILPIPADCGELAIIGPNAKLGAACGGGSASLRPYYTSSVMEGIERQVAPGTKIHYEVGTYGHILQPLLDKLAVCNMDGKPGVTIEFFNEPSRVAGRKAFDRIEAPDAVYQLMDYAHPDAKEVFYISMSMYFTPQESGRYEFGLAVDGTANLYINDQLIIENTTSQRSGSLFFGRGTAEEKATWEMEAKVCYLLRVECGSAATSTLAGQFPVALPGGACRLGGCLQIDPEKNVQQAVDLVRNCKYTIVVVGLNSDFEKEGTDRQNMDLPPGVEELVKAVLSVQPDAIIVTQSGTPVSMSFSRQASTMIHSWYGGNEAGNAVGAVLFGKFNPSGKLPMTFPKRLEDNPSFLSFGTDNGKLHYSEDVFVGYRWYDARKIDAEFRFG
ncbi:glycoside hydrolase family 3 protein [Cadophora sp. DSE1049]|nr:glycoside hydrolase family 3 protein [Cadophora sp. DSE1049]